MLLVTGRGGARVGQGKEKGDWQGASVSSCKVWVDVRLYLLGGCMEDSDNEAGSKEPTPRGRSKRSRVPGRDRKKNIVDEPVTARPLTRA
eukprot:evm.model.NODE_15301_length_14779_cov_26.990324.4